MNIGHILAGGAFLTIAFTGSAGYAQSVAVCEQNIAYQLEAPTDEVPPAIRGFSGIWVGSWDSRICTALVVESIQADGTARVIYIHGTVTGPGPMKPAFYRATGKISGNLLTFKTGSVSHERTLRGPNEMTGKHIASWGTLNAKFTRQ